MQDLLIQSIDPVKSVKSIKPINPIQPHTKTKSKLTKPTMPHNHKPNIHNNQIIPTNTKVQNLPNLPNGAKLGQKPTKTNLPIHNQSYRINHMIRASEVRVVFDNHKPANEVNGKEIENEHINGCEKQKEVVSEVMPLQKALELSLKYGVDLIEIAPKANPPVCKLMDYGKFIYREQKNHKRDKHTKSKEIGCHVNIAEHDLNTKIRHAEEFLQHSHQVVFKVAFRGREAVHKEIGVELLKTIEARLAKHGLADGSPKLNGKMVMLRFSPKKQNNHSNH